MRRTALSTIAAAALALVALAGCGSGDSPSVTNTPADVVVTTSDQLKFDKSTYAASAGELTIELKNPGSIPHTLRIDGNDGFRLSTTGQDEDRDTVTLEPGTYTIYCDIPGHRASGMEATIEVT